MPFISTSSGIVIWRSTSSAAWPGHCVTIWTCGGERSGIGVDRQVLERDDAPDRQADHRDEDDEALRRGRRRRCGRSCAAPSPGSCWRTAGRGCPATTTWSPSLRPSTISIWSCCWRADRDLALRELPGARPARRRTGSSARRRAPTSSARPAPRACALSVDRRRRGTDPSSAARRVFCGHDAHRRRARGRIDHVADVRRPCRGRRPGTTSCASRPCRPRGSTCRSLS